MACSNQQIKPDPINRVDTKHKANEYQVRYFYEQEKMDEVKYCLKKDGLNSKAYFEVRRQDGRQILDVSKPIPNEVLEKFVIGEPKQKSKGCYKVTFTLKKGVFYYNTQKMDQYFLPRTPSPPIDRQKEHENQGDS